ncbi:MAG: DHH family phosphoesterase [Nitrospirota bacterium]
MHRRWLVNRTNQDYIDYLSRAASISPLLSQILINRGIKTPEAADSFLRSDVSNLSNPFDMAGMDRAVHRILAAAKKGERILVHGDYDADGISATVILVKALRLSGVDCSYFIPDRMEHGYGFKPQAVQYAKKVGATLIVTVDCGITSFEAAALCRKEGIDVVITDHHEPVKSVGHGAKGASDSSLSAHGAPLLPEAVAVINPKISDPLSPVWNLSGAGVALKLIQALAMNGARFAVHDFFDLAALGTAGDVVPLSGENRLVVKEGLKRMADGSCIGIKALRQVSGTAGKELKSGHLLFALIPRMNAAGRISNAGDVVRLFLTDSENEAFDLSTWLDRCNAERQRIEEEVYQEALQQLTGKGVRPVIVLSSEGWHKGVVGIVASRIVETFYRPTVILSIEGNSARGSARSIPSFDIHHALAECRMHLTGFGGHRQAAGLELESRNIAAFEECINEFAEARLSPEDFIPVLEIDAAVDLADITFSLTREFELLEPFGYGNPEPLLGTRGVEVLSPRIVKDVHLKMKLRQKNLSLDAIGFDMASSYQRIQTAPVVDAAFTPCVNVWEGRTNLQLRLKALRPGV